MKPLISLNSWVTLPPWSATDFLALGREVSGVSWVEVMMAAYFSSSSALAPSLRVT